MSTKKSVRSSEPSIAVVKAISCKSAKVRARATCALAQLPVAESGEIAPLLRQLAKSDLKNANQAAIKTAFDTIDADLAIATAALRQLRKQTDMLINQLESARENNRKVIAVAALLDAITILAG